MAYTATVTYVDVVIKSVAHKIVTVVETEVTGNTHEYQINAPNSGVASLTFHKAVLATGGAGITATVVDPQLGEATGSGATQSASIFANGVAAATTRNVADARGYVSGGKFFGRSMCDGNVGTTGTITSTIILVEGHH